VVVGFLKVLAEYLFFKARWPPFFILLIDGSSRDLSGDIRLIRSILLLELLLNSKYVFLDQNHDTIYIIFTQMWNGCLQGRERQDGNERQSLRKGRAGRRWTAVSMRCQEGSERQAGGL
jgi:hypothetical protein